MFKDNLKELILSRYEEPNIVNKFATSLFNIFLIILLFSNVFLLAKIVFGMILAINIARRALDGKIRKDIHKATAKEYSWSLSLSIVEKILFMLSIALFEISAFRIFVLLVMVLIVNFEARVLLDFRQLAKENNVK